MTIRSCRKSSAISRGLSLTLRSEKLYTKKIYFSGGDFHELQELFSEIPGVVEVTAGFISAKNVCSYANPEPRELENISGVEVKFNPKKIDLSILMDILFGVLNPYSENNLGVYYASGEDEPQVELHLNFIANRGKQPLATNACITVNDTTLNPKFARKCYAAAGRLKNFVAAPESDQNFLKKNPEAKTDIDFKKLKATLRF